MLRPKLINMREMEKYLETECSDINYTVVRPPGLSNGSLSGKHSLKFWRCIQPSSKLDAHLGKEVKFEDGAYFLKRTSGPLRMPRADVAKFILDCLPKSELFKKSVAVGL